MAPWPLIRDLLFLRDRLDRLLEEAQLYAAGGVSEPSGGPFSPAADLYQTGSEAVVVVEVAGVEVDSLDLRAQGDTLRVSGRIRSPEPGASGRYLRLERARGAFYRDFKLPFDVGGGTPRAVLERGVLTVRVAAPRPASARRVVGIREDA